MAKRHHKSTIEQAQRIMTIVERYYEQGNHRRSYRVVWERYVRPLYPMTFRSFQNYLAIARKAKEGASSPPPDALAYSLFDYWDQQMDRLGRVKP
ncbi:hypothetical protein [Porphyromonas loveana]|uniref:hypothetical protein n=1 Tax=Porphyromonas loveana TaxID=1884669 RepID=UPI00359F2512